jgi:hypothetical protein
VMSAIEMMVCRLDEARKFTRDSVFVDFGCTVFACMWLNGTCYEVCMVWGGEGIGAAKG